ncbi:MAG TPA: LysM peptidoglycan-binding domain-containing protein, partial [Blastocatellia bacterium]|nr:LysM peptidoglycan-binding domain-containing protein [Blastocatellia bacterium]
MLQPATTVPPGTVGFEMTRTNPDPNNLPYDQLTPAQVVGSLFNLVGFNIAQAGGFIKSGAGLPTTPADSWQDQTDGLEQRDLDDSTDPNWYYHQTLAVYPFATAQNGSASPALPPVASNPYNGVGFNATANQINEVTLNLDVQDIYGNIQPLPQQFASLQVPVGYYDDIANLGSWPSLAISYLVTGAQPNPVISFQMTMQQARYVPAPGVAATSALSSAQADLVSYQNIYYQLSQPDLSFSLQTSLDTDSMASLQAAYSLAKTPFYSFAYGAYVYLAALATMQPVQVTSDGTTSVEALTAQYGVTAGQLFTANQDALYSTLFGAEMLVVPLMYSTVAGDSLSSVAAKYGLTADALATTNETAPLAPGVDLATPERSLSVSGSATQSLNSIAQSAQASAAGIAETNADLTDILQPGVTLSIGTQLYQVVAGDSFNSVAAALGSTVADVASANQYLQGLFVEGAVLGITDAVAGSGDTLQTIATKFADGDVNTLATTNADVQDLFAAGTQLQVGINNQAKPPQPTDSLSSFATNNTVTVAQLAAANASSSTVFAAGAEVGIPGVTTNTSPQQFCTYTAAAQDTLGGIAAKFNQQAATIAALNPDIPGLFVAGQTITTGGKSVTTAAGDTFDSIIARFGQQGVTVTLSQLAAAVAAQSGLLAAGGLWICPPMLGNANGQNSAGTLDGLAAAYNIPDVTTLATSNAAAIGLLASGVQLNQWSVEITTNQFETFNSLVNRLAEAGINTTVEDVATTLSSQANLIQPQAMVVPVPPPSPLGNQATIHPKFASSVFQIAVNVVTTRNAQWVDPDFANVAAVGKSVYSVAPEPDPQNEGNSSPYSLTQFATDLQAALPGLQAATGDPVAVDDPASANTIWAVNFGNSNGPQINYQFQGANTQYFALPPLSTSLMGGAVDIIPYVSGQTPPFTGAPTTQTFQAVDLDVWLNTFLQTVDLFLSPAYAVPAYALDPTNTVSVVEQKQTLAQMLSARLQYVLQGEQAGSLSDAQGAMYQALLTELSSAFTIDTVVQVPVSVTTTGEQPAAPPNLSGKIVMNDPGNSTSGQSLPSTFSFSTAKATLAAPGSTATFLFNVKSPASHKDANLNLQYAVTELELPDPNSTIGDYEGSSWLQFILPLNGTNANTNSNIGNVDIPIPLRSYPSPVTLAAQTARQSVADPAAVTDLLGWDFGFVYQHDDAEQDSPMAAVTFNATSDTVQGLGRNNNNNANLTNIYNALAQFMAAYPVLKNDLALLTQVAPGTANATAQAAVQALGWLVNEVTSAWQRTPMAAMFIPETETYCYQMEKGLTDGATPALETLTLNSIDIDTGAAKATTLWPSIVALYEGGTHPLPVNSIGQQTQATYSYPTGADAIPAATQLQQCFMFGPAIAPSGASRAGGVTTITTTVPHGLSAGDQVIISGVTDASFNGIFTVTAASSATAFSYAQAAAPNTNSGNGTASKLIAWGASQSIAPSGALRASGVTTVTTLAPHGLFAGNQVVVAGVADASFNGLFTVASVPNATSFTYAQTGLADIASSGGTAGGLLPAATTGLVAPQLFSFNDANILSWQNALAGVAITRNQSLIEGVPTNPAFVYQTPISNFTSLAIPSVFA